MLKYGSKILWLSYINKIIDYLDFISSPVYILKRRFGDWTVSIVMQEPSQLGPISRHRNQHKAGYVNQTERKPSAGEDKYLKAPHIWGLVPIPTYNLTVRGHKFIVLSK
jgi:hypothetical protein